MRRSTLVNFSIEDDNKRAVPMLGLRATQQLDQSILLAAALASTSRTVVGADVTHFVQRLIAGPAETVKEAYEAFTKRPGSFCPSDYVH